MKPVLGGAREYRFAGLVGDRPRQWMQGHRSLNPQANLSPPINRNDIASLKAGLLAGSMALVQSEPEEGEQKWPEGLSI